MLLYANISASAELVPCASLCGDFSSKRLPIILIGCDMLIRVPSETSLYGCIQLFQLQPTLAISASFCRLQ